MGETRCEHVMGIEQRRMGEKLSAWVAGIQQGLKRARTVEVGQDRKARLRAHECPERADNDGVHGPM
jgi:hypothetical protein